MGDDRSGWDGRDGLVLLLMVIIFNSLQVDYWRALCGCCRIIIVYIELYVLEYTNTVIILLFFFFNAT